MARTDEATERVLSSLVFCQYRWFGVLLPRPALGHAHQREGQVLVQQRRWTMEPPFFETGWTSSILETCCWDETARPNSQRCFLLGDHTDGYPRASVGRIF
jgi:hypothetical protein